LIADAVSTTGASRWRCRGSEARAAASTDRLRTAAVAGADAVEVADEVDDEGSGVEWAGSDDDDADADEDADDASVEEGSGDWGADDSANSSDAAVESSVDDGESKVEGAASSDDVDDDEEEDDNSTGIYVDADVCSSWPCRDDTGAAMKSYVSSDGEVARVCKSLRSYKSASEVVVVVGAAEAKSRP
jgi:hypothetical protein